jgi:diguanylate cyclase (GGDEF)-like protein
MTTMLTRTLDISQLLTIPAPDPVLVDQLTRLPNHRAFQERLRKDLAAAREQGRPLSLARFDLDRFKALNGTAGHDTGDRLLIAIADRLLSFTRSGDTLARTGGDEFALLLPSCSSEDAYAVVERARDAITAAPVTAGFRLTISAGICERSFAADAEDLWDLAGSALYRSKLHGRDGTCVYEPGLDAPLARRGGSPSRLERAEALHGIRALARAVDAKDPATQRHSERVAILARRLAEQLRWTPERLALLEEAALVHDVGKIGVPDAVLLKPERLDADEYEIVKRHAALSAEIVGDVLTPEQVAWIRGHHERPDGSGYPDHLAGDQISDGAAVLALADAFDVMTSERPYSRPRDWMRAVEECAALAGKQFAPDPVRALIALADGR